jgi:hypothetical protein
MTRSLPTVNADSSEAMDHSTLAGCGSALRGPIVVAPVRTDNRDPSRRPIA